MSKTEIHGDVGQIIQANTAHINIGVQIKAGNNPNLISCPDCFQPVSRGSDGCPACGLNVVRHFQQIKDKQLRKESLVGAAFGVSMMVLGYFAMQLFPENFGGVGGLMSVCGMFVTMGMMHRASEPEKYR